MELSNESFHDDDRDSVVKFLQREPGHGGIVRLTRARHVVIQYHEVGEPSHRRTKARVGDLVSVRDDGGFVPTINAKGQVVIITRVSVSKNLCYGMIDLFYKGTILSGEHEGKNAYLRASSFKLKMTLAEQDFGIPLEMTPEYWDRKENTEETIYGRRDEYGGL